MYTSPWLVNKYKIIWLLTKYMNARIAELVYELEIAVQILYMNMKLQNKPMNSRLWTNTWMNKYMNIKSEQVFVPGITEQLDDPGLLNKHMNPRLLNITYNQDCWTGLRTTLLNTWTRDCCAEQVHKPGTSERALIPLSVCDPEHAALESTYFSCIYLKLILTFRNSGFLFSLSYAFFKESLGELI